MTAYLDNSATTPVCSEAVEAMKTAVTELWGNPSSLHQKGIEADEMLENARSNVARRLFCRDDEVYFTSGGTESNNLAVQGAASMFSLSMLSAIQAVHSSSMGWLMSYLV